MGSPWKVAKEKNKTWGFMGLRYRSASLSMGRGVGPRRVGGTERSRRPWWRRSGSGSLAASLVLHSRAPECTVFVLPLGNEHNFRLNKIHNKRDFGPGTRFSVNPRNSINHVY